MMCRQNELLCNRQCLLQSQACCDASRPLLIATINHLINQSIYHFVNKQAHTKTEKNYNGDWTPDYRLNSSSRYKSDPFNLFILLLRACRIAIFYSSPYLPPLEVGYV